MAPPFELLRRIAILETELRQERTEHALTQQCVLTMARQLATQQAVTTGNEHHYHCGDGPGTEHHRKVAQRAEHEGRPTWADQRVQPPTVHQPLDGPTPLSQAFYQQDRIGGLPISDRHTDRTEIIDLSKHAEAPLIAIEPEGPTHQQAPSRGRGGEMQLHPVFTADRGERAPLSLESLAGRFKNQPFNTSGVDASRWAAKEPTPDVEDVPDLMQFDDDEQVEVIDEAKLKEMEEEAKKKHQRELRKNQALVMFEPAPSEDAFRTVLATDIPAGLSTADVMALVHGGIVVSIREMNTTPITSSETIMITFLHAKAAKDFLSVADNSKVKFSLLKTPAYPLNGCLSDDIIYNGVTRCLDVYRLHEEISMAALCRVLAEPGTEHHDIISAGRDQVGVVHVDFSSVVAAQMAHMRARRHPFFRFTDIEFAADPCDCVVAGMADDKGGERVDDVDAETGAEEETGADEKTDAEVKTSIEEKSGPGGKTGIEAEESAEEKTGAEADTGIEEQAKERKQMSDQAEKGRETEKVTKVEKDVSGWPIGGLDYD